WFSESGLSMKALLCAITLVPALTSVAALTGVVARTSVAAVTSPLDHVAVGADPLTTLEQALETQPDELRAGNDYRMAVIQAGQYDRALAFFQKLIAAHPASANAHLNYGFAYVDKIPVAGAITQVILANNAINEFSQSLDLKPSWIGYYARGNGYLYWPRVFDKAKLGVADLENAMRIQKSERKRAYQVRAFIALGDAYWRVDDFAKATATWKEGLAQFPDNAALAARLAKQGDDLKALLDEVYDPTKRVDTSLKPLWTD